MEYSDRCPKCGGLFVDKPCVDELEALSPTVVWLKRCVACGLLWDEVIAQHQRKSFLPHKPQNPRNRVIMAMMKPKHKKVSEDLS